MAPVERPSRNQLPLGRFRSEPYTEPSRASSSIFSNSGASVFGNRMADKVDMTGNLPSGRLKMVFFSRDPPILIGAVEGRMHIGPASIISPPLKGRAFWLLLKHH